VTSQVDKPAPLTVEEALAQARAYPVLGVGVQATAAIPLSPFGFGGGVSLGLGLVWDRFGGIRIAAQGAGLAGVGLNLSAGVNVSAAAAGTIHGVAGWQTGVTAGAGKFGLEYQPGQVGGDLGIDMGITGGAWVQSQRTVVLPIVEPT
jgi:hypothetical protein